MQNVVYQASQQRVSLQLAFKNYTQVELHQRNNIIPHDLTLRLVS